MDRDEPGRGQAAPAGLQGAASISEPGFDGATRLDLGGFCEGTLIDTQHGQRLIEHLQPGDLIHTAERGFVPLVRNWAIPQDLAPACLMRLRPAEASLEPSAGARLPVMPGHPPGMTVLHALPSQCLHLGHSLATRLFQTRSVLVQMADLVTADPVPRHDRQVYRLDLGPGATVIAAGLACAVFSENPKDNTSLPGQLSRRDARLFMASLKRGDKGRADR